MKFAYADPPYIGQARKHYKTEEVDQIALIARLCAEYSDGWVLSASAKTLHTILDMAPSDVRVGIWVKPLVLFRPGVNPCYGWEPVIWRGGRQRSRYEPTGYDWHLANTTFKTGTHGAKPESFCFWIFNLLNAQPGDEMADLFTGSGAVTRAWEKWVRQYRLQSRPHNRGKVRLAEKRLIEGS